MAAHDHPAPPPTSAGERSQQTSAPEGDARAARARWHAAAAAKRATELQGSTTALLRRADVLLASSDRRLSRIGEKLATVSLSGGNRRRA